jgi:hypothetical protein
MKPRPITIPLEDFESQWETIFGARTNKPQPTIEPIPFAGMVDVGEEMDVAYHKDGKVTSFKVKK